MWHIADVSWYVTEGSPLDSEALKRGTSVYLVDRVIPMLPPKLSNGVCSLNPGEDRLAFTVMMDIDAGGKVLRHEIFESVIRSSERMTYTDVYRLLETGDEELMERYGYLADDFRSMKDLALALRCRRMARGAMEFNFDEAKVILDEEGRPVDVRRYEITIANRIIEESCWCAMRPLPSTSSGRTCPLCSGCMKSPTAKRLLRSQSLQRTWLSPERRKHTSRALQDVLERVKSRKEELIISTMLRSC